MTVVYWDRYPNTPGEPVYSKSFDSDVAAQAFALRKEREYAYTVGRVWTKTFVESKEF
jgi:hypothetical protein